MDLAEVTVVALGVVVFALVSGRLQDSILTGPMLFTAFGFLVGDAVFGIAHLDFGHAFVHGLAEVTLVFVLFSDAARIELRQAQSQNLPIRLLVIGLPLIIVAGTLVGCCHSGSAFGRWRCWRPFWHRPTQRSVRALF
jgi:NhaP-type Na+/H+ or K+/H+ antiporter